MHAENGPVLNGEVKAGAQQTSEQQRRGYDVFRNARREYERCHTRDERMKFFVKYARFAPSLFNSQPWLFRMSGDAIGVCVNRERLLPGIDSHRRLVYVSAGAALRYLETALNYAGVSYHLQLFPSFSDWDLIASVHLWASRFSRSVNSESLYPDSTPAEGHPVGAPDVENGFIDEIARQENVHIHRVSSEKVVEAVLRTAHHDGWAMPASNDPYVGAINNSMWRSLLEGAGDGTGVAHPDRMIDPLLLSQTTQWPEQLLLISSFADNVVSRVMTGRALGRLQLHYHPAGYALYVLPTLIDNEHGREHLQSIVDCDRYPQLLVTVRNMEATKPLARRPVAEMIR